MASGNRTSSIEHGSQIHPSSGDNGGGACGPDGFNLSSENQVDYTYLPEEVQQHFEDCGTVNRVTILTDNFGHPKGYAYVEFLEVEAVQNALLLNDTELHERRLKVCPKRTNIPGMNHPRGRRPYDPYYPSYPTYG
ncbi:hypothetical protein ACQ4PT_066422 [Festuca glaucescens]